MSQNKFYLLIILIMFFTACGKRSETIVTIKPEPIAVKEISKEELTEINLIVEAIVTQKNLDVLKQNKNSEDLIMESLYKIKVIEDAVNSDDYILPPAYKEIFYSQLIRDKYENKPLFTSEDSLYIMQQNNYSDKIKIAASFLEKVNTEKTVKDKLKENSNLYFGKYEISIPILSKDMQSAYVKLDYYCGALCGNGSTFFFKKIDGKWTIVEDIFTWIS